MEAGVSEKCVFDVIRAENSAFHESGWDRPTQLYRYYDDGGNLLYVGITSQPNVREEKHRRQSPWRIDAAYIRYELFPSWSIAEMAELISISREAPQHNRRRPPGESHHEIEATMEPFPAHRAFLEATGGRYVSDQVFWAKLADIENASRPPCCDAPFDSCPTDMP